MSADESEITSEAFEDLVARAEQVLYPCTITPTRYSGTYEGGRWAAFRLYPEKLPPAAFAGDLEATAWWAGVEAPWVGVGETPLGAFRDLVRRWSWLGCRKCRGIGMVPQSPETWTACPTCHSSGKDEDTKCGYCGRSMRPDELAPHLKQCEARRKLLWLRYPREGEAAIPEPT
jgi:hypothetical protein